MVLIDTSVWIGLYRKRSHPLGELLWTLVGRNDAAICGQVWLEFIGGFQRETERKAYAEFLAAFPWLETPREVYTIAAEWLARHPPLGPGDAIIASTAVAHRATLLTTDGDFSALTRYGLLLYRQ